jgi:phosphatidylglycerol---prolipoprotein diacylglyceryl transferase
MHPVLFEIHGVPGIGDIKLRAFGLMVAIGFLLASQWLWPRLLRRHGLEPEKDVLRVPAVAFWVLIGVLLGGRAMYVVVEVARHLSGATGFDSFGALVLERPWKAFFIWEGGMAMYGGFAGAVLAGSWAAKKHGLDLANGLDTGLTAGFLGQAIGRVGCLLVGDDYGRIVPPAWRDAPFPIVRGSKRTPRACSSATSRAKSCGRPNRG